MDAVFKTMKRHISLLAQVGFAGSVISLTARIPIGVAALPSPRKLAQILELKWWESLGFVRVEGNRRFVNGRKRAEMYSVKPVLSVSFPTPVHRQTAPAMERESCIPACAPVGIAAARALPFPKNIEKTQREEIENVHYT